LTAQASPTGASDYVAIYDAELGAARKVLLDNLPGGASGGAFSGLSDVTISSPVDNATLRYDSASGDWENNNNVEITSAGSLTLTASNAGVTADIIRANKAIDLLENATEPGSPSSGVRLFVNDVNGVKQVKAKFADGTVRDLINDTP